MASSRQKRIALVTGAAQGIGRAVVRRLATDGCEIWCFDQNTAALEDLKRGHTDTAQAPIHLLPGDAGDEKAVASAMACVHDTHGRLDILVNNAGIADPFNGPIECLSLADWDRIIRTNLTGYFLFAKHAIPLLRARRGCIVNMASSRALQSEPHTEAYAASKGGIESLTHALAMSLGPEIRVNAVAPGWIDVRAEQNGAPAEPEPLRALDHSQHPGGRVGRGEDIAGVVAFLCGPDAAFITGQMLVADGGMMRKMIYHH